MDGIFFLFGMVMIDAERPSGGSLLCLFLLFCLGSLLIGGGGVDSHRSTNNYVYYVMCGK